MNWKMLQRPVFTLALVAGAALTGCDEDLPDPQFLYGESLVGLEFVVLDLDQGVHPNTSITSHPDNPFRRGISLEAKFDAETLGPIPAFYGWAQALAQEPTGEHQYFAAAAARDIYNFELAEEEDLVFARSIAVRGFQNCLTEFPDTTAFFDVTGNQRTDLLAEALQGVIELGGEVPAGWVLIEQADGTFVATFNGN